MTKQTTIPSLKKGLQVLETIADAPDGIGVDGINTATRVPRTTLVRILNTLEEANYVFRTGRRFFATPPFARQSLHTPAMLRKHALPHLQRLLEATGETAELGILHKNQILYLVKLEARDSSIKMFFEEGKHYRHMHASGICKVLLAHLPRATVIGILDRDGLPRFTPKTVTERPRLLKDLQTIREQGGHIESEENRVGVKRISVPIFLNTHILGAVGYVGPVSNIPSRLSDKRILNEVKKTAKQVSKELSQ